MAVELLQSVGISQLPVLREGQAVGSIQEITLALRLHDGGDPSKVTLGEIMARPLPQVDVSVHLDEAYRLLLAGNTGVLAVSDGIVLDIITRIDLVQYWNKSPGRWAIFDCLQRFSSELRIMSAAFKPQRGVHKARGIAPGKCAYPNLFLSPCKGGSHDIAGILRLMGGMGPPFQKLRTKRSSISRAMPRALYGTPRWG